MQRWAHDESESGEWKSWLKAQHWENEDHGILSHHFMGNRWGNSVRLYFSGLQNHCRWWPQPLMKVKEENEKVGLKLNIQKTKIMPSGPMANRWGNNGNSERLYFFRLQNHCRWWLHGSYLVTDWLLLLPPGAKTQMACFGWSKAPVSYSLGSAQPPRDSRIAHWVGA